jgi:hypothetical protein
VAGLGVPAASRFNAAVTVCLIAVVAGLSGAVAPAFPAVPVAGLPGPDAAAVPDPAPSAGDCVAGGWVPAAGGVADGPVVQPDSTTEVRPPTASSTTALPMTVLRCRVSAGRLMTEVACRLTVVRFMPPFCHGASPRRSARVPAEVRRSAAGGTPECRHPAAARPA